ncbi:hydrogenase maturation protease [Embleya sp. NBC_00896]|uniref:hydrogenase maturation protease n=1 Tax=Embleya sp. NBC_00896 TaxID=2975961 RepID=UPI002F9162D9|nr:hydrogenase maturation protease [Embleya sp. NBC_00896]
MSAGGQGGGAGHVLVAGVGNIFLGDDGFGVETVRRLAGHTLPARVEVVDFGVRGVHLAYQLLEGYRTLVLVDATARGGEPGTVYLIEAATPGAVEPGSALLDGHRMGPDAVLALLGTLSAGTGGTPPRRVLVVGCEPASLDEGIGLSPPVAEAVDEAVDLILRVLHSETRGSSPDEAHDAVPQVASNPTRDDASPAAGASETGEDTEDTRPDEKKEASACETS